MRPRHLLLLAASSGLAICAPNPVPVPVPVPEAEPNVESNGNQITLSSEEYYSSGSGAESDFASSATSSATSSSSFSVKATTSKDDGKRLKYLDRDALDKEYDALERLKVQLKELDETVKQREGWFKSVVCEGEDGAKVECVSPVCAFGKVFSGVAGGLRKRSEKCWEGMGREGFPLPPWRGGGERGEREGKYRPPGWIKVLNSGVLEVLVIVFGVGLGVLSWGLMRDGKGVGDGERLDGRRRGCCGWRWRGGEENVEEREKLVGFGEHADGESNEEAVPPWEEPRFEIGSDSESEDGATGTTVYDIPRPRYQQQEEAERRVQTWVPEPGYESESEGMVADGIYTVPRPTAGQEDRERQLRDQDLAARQRYAPSLNESDTLAGTRSPSEVDSLEGVSMSQELAAFRDAFGLVEDLVASVEQRRRQI
ncbi:hypothetical protein QC762_303950 [Podospora pseudocomata]|uniref:Uncharacterized protein n=1 Tax=Podospora pseudocomata TaxID=2093779 RepID=A0ABR0GIQ3_9PEZI|nr:hypothetical protein QC762_303950 [Podospora pseudocomata]